MIVVTKPRSSAPVTDRLPSPVVVMLGSNIEPEKFLPAAVEMLGSLGQVTKVSSVWQTRAIGYEHQDDFCNAGVLLETSLSPAVLLKRLRTIETRLGRVRDPLNKNGPRTIDLDLAVLSGSPRVVSGRMFPDPDIADRVFLAAPLEEILPDFSMPDGRGIGEIAAQLRHRDARKLGLSLRPDILLQSPAVDR